MILFCSWKSQACKYSFLVTFLQTIKLRRKIQNSRRGALDFQFCGFSFCLNRFFVLAPWNRGFRFFSFFSIWFWVIVKNTNGFLDLLSNVVFGFYYSGSSFSSIDLSGSYAPPVISISRVNANVIERKVWQTKCHQNNFE